MHPRVISEPFQEQRLQLFISIYTFVTWETFARGEMTIKSCIICIYAKCPSKNRALCFNNKYKLIINSNITHLQNEHLPKNIRHQQISLVSLICFGDQSRSK